MTESWSTPAESEGTSRKGPGADRLLTAKEVAQLLAVPESWVREATREGRIPYLALGRYRRYERTELEAWIAAQRSGPAAPRRSRLD
jgi:excisionase family DNA binding protein